ncbi:MAG: GMP synthase [Gemmatimonadaceae bacterium]|nr:GMP synthase [Chitinophagaceae bacterium]
MNSERRSIRVAILDLYEGQANQGMRCLREILVEYGKFNHLDLTWDEFDVRQRIELPGLNYDIYISSGGPGSPLDSENTEWENRYFQWVRNAEVHKKYVFFICHSFQLAVRYFGVAEVMKRKSTAFGVFPVHLLRDGKYETVFSGLRDPFYAVDSRDYQVVAANEDRLREMGAQILCIEKDRPHVPLERAIMGIRFNEYMIGTQFHPEADPGGMSMYLQRTDKKKMVIENHGEEKWRSMIEQLNDPDKIFYTYTHVIPNFLNEAVENLLGVEV